MAPPATGFTPLGEAPVGHSERTGAYGSVERASGAVHGSGWSAASGIRQEHLERHARSPASGQDYVPYTQHEHQQRRDAALLGQPVPEDGEEETQSLLGRQSLPSTVPKDFSTDMEPDFELERARLLAMLEALNAEEQATEMEAAAAAQTPAVLKREHEPRIKPEHQAPRTVKLPPPSENKNDAVARAMQTQAQICEQVSTQLAFMQQRMEDEAQRQFERDERSAETVRLQQVALTNFHRPQNKGPQDLTSAELTSLKCTFQPHLITDWEVRATARLTERCPELGGVIMMPDDAWEACKDQDKLRKASAWAAGQFAVMVDQEDAAGKAFMGDLVRNYPDALPPLMRQG